MKTNSKLALGLAGYVLFGMLVSETSPRKVLDSERINSPFGRNKTTLIGKCADSSLKTFLTSTTKAIDSDADGNLDYLHVYAFGRGMGLIQMRLKVSDKLQQQYQESFKQSKFYKNYEKE